MVMRHGWVLLMLFVPVACSAPAPPAPPAAAPVPTKLAGMWSDPPPSSIGQLCFISCTDASIERLNALLDDPANDSRPYGELRAAAEKHARDNYFRPHLSEAALKTYPLDPADDPGFLRCEPWGLAKQMFAPHQLEIRPIDADRIELRYGEWEAVRTVYLDGRKAPADLAPSRLGFAVGHWEGETLVVETSGVAANITWWSAQHSDQLRVVERFTRSDEDDTLRLTATIEDAWSLREPIVLKKIWRWAPGQKITPYDACEPATDFSRGKGQS